MATTTRNAGATHDAFSDWDDRVAKWLNERRPGTGATAEWSALCASPLSTGGGTREDSNTWLGFRMCVQRRLKWLASYAPAVSDSTIETQIQGTVDEGRSILEIDDPHQAHGAFVQWVNSTASKLQKLQPHSRLSTEWAALPYSNLIMGGTWSRKQEDWAPFREVIISRISWLGKLLAAESSAKATVTTLSNRVFIVHGHNDALKESCARFLGKLKLEPVILHDEPNKGRTIIEKFIDYADVGFAVVLMTGDDQGGTKDAKRENNRPRARQNVILELGYFLGKLGRERVCAIYDPGVEIPSDYDGVLWLEHDRNGAWKTLLAKEIKAAGLAIDLNDLI